MSLLERYKEGSRPRPENKWQDTPEAHAEVIVFDIIDDLRGRGGGFDDMFENIDPVTKEELLQTNVDMVATRLKSAVRALS